MTGLFRASAVFVVPLAVICLCAAQTQPDELPGVLVGAEEANQVMGGVCGDYDLDDCDWLNFCTETECIVDSSSYHDISGDATLPNSCGSSCYTYYTMIDEGACDD